MTKSIKVAPSSFAPGSGVFATKPFAKGAAVLVETPFLLVPYDQRLGEGRPRNAKDMLRLLGWLTARGLADEPWTRAWTAFARDWTGETAEAGAAADAALRVRMSDAEHQEARVLMLRDALAGLEAEEAASVAKAKLGALATNAALQTRWGGGETDELADLGLRFLANCLPLGELGDLDQLDLDALLAGETQHGVFECGCRIQHACAPNLTWGWSDGAMTFTALKRIKRGEELTISYGGPSVLGVQMPPALTRELVKERCGFDCACTACSAA